MDHKHRLNAPNNETLSDIEQVSDRSELASLYFKPRDEWEGKELLSEEQRTTKRDAELVSSQLSARKHFATLGILIPTPIIMLVLLISWAAAYLRLDTLKFMLPVAVGAVLAWGIVSYLSIRKTYRIFYEHTINAGPFMIASTILIGLSVQELALLTQPLHTESFLTNTILVSTATYLASIVLLALLLNIWVTQRLSGKAKMIGIGLIALCILLGIFLTAL